jgi:hypothetical protein
MDTTNYHKEKEYHLQSWQLNIYFVFVVLGVLRQRLLREGGVSTTEWIFFLGAD